VILWLLIMEVRLCRYNPPVFVAGAEKDDQKRLRPCRWLAVYCW
jgi:hypothetical protein